MAKIIVNLNELKGTSFYRNYIEKAKKGEMVGGKYMYREEVPEKVKTSKGKTTVIRYKYYYLADMLKDSAEKLLENIGKFFFKGNEKEVKKIENSYKTQNIEKDYGADKKTWYQHCMEYLSHKAKWDKRFSDKTVSEKFKKPIKQKVAEKVDIPGMETAAEETPEIKTTIETEKKEVTWKPNPSLMRKVWSLYNGVESVNNGVSVGDTVNFNGRKGTVTKKVNDNMVMVSFEDGGLGRFFAKDLNKVEISNESVTNEADVNGKIQEVVTGLNTSNDTVEETKENLTNIFNSTNNGVAKQLREKFNSITNEYLGTKFVNKKTGIQAEFSTTSQKELRSRLENSKRNGFTIQEHFELANKIKELFENASLEKKHKDNKNNDENVNIERFLSEPVVLSTGKKVQACITVKHILNKDGHYVYSLETMDIKNALEKTRAKGGDHIGDSPNTYNNTTNIENVNSEHGNKIAMLGNQNAKKNFVDFIDKFITNGYKSDKVVNLLDTTPSILQEHGIPNNPISITPSVLKKILENDLNVYHGHNISIDILKDLPNQLENPVYILKGKDGKKIIVTEYYVENRPIITILEIDRKEGRTNVNSVRSLYDKQNDVFMEWIKDDSIVEYENKEKSKVLLQSIGNQYTKEVTTPYINNNTTNIENVNSEHGNKIAMLGNQNAKKQFSDLTQEEKQQKKEQIQNNIVSSIQKDSVPYNNDGAFDKAAKTWLEKNNVGNAETVIGEVIINRRSVERDMHHGDLADKYLKLQTLPAVKDVLEKGTYLGYERDFEGKNISNHYFAAKINYGNEEKIVFCRVRETDGSEERFYVHEVFTEDEIKKGTNLVPTVGRLPQLTGKLLYNFILQEVLNVNSEHGNKIAMLGNQNAAKPFSEEETKKEQKKVKETREKAGLPKIGINYGERVSAMEDSVSLNPNAENYAYKDTGYIAGSQKEKIQDFWKRKKESGEGTSIEEIDWNTLEENPRYAEQQITKSNILGNIDYNSFKEKGMDSRVAYLASRVFAAIPKEPIGHDVTARKNYVIAINTVKERLSECKTLQDVKEFVDDVYGEYKQTFDSQILRVPEVNKLTQERDGIIKEKNKIRVSVMEWCRNELVPKYKALGKKERKAFWRYKEELKKEISEKIREFDPDYNNPYMYIDIDTSNMWWPINVSSEGILQEKIDKANNKLKTARENAKNIIMNNNVTYEVWKELGDFADLRYSKTFQNHYNNLTVYDEKQATKPNGEIYEPYDYKYRDKEYDKYENWDWVDKKTNKKAKPESEIIEGKVKRTFEMIVPETIERVGGRNVSVKSTEELKKAFNFRDIQTGSYVQSDPVSAKWHIDNLASGFADLCDVLGIRDDQVSLNGRLALAVGARGHGRALAHYEPVERVINITKFKGGGSLGHEWFHGFDNMIAEAITGGNISVFMSDPGEASKTYMHDDIPDNELAQKVRGKFINLVDAMMTGDTPETEVITYKSTDVETAKKFFEKDLPFQAAYYSYGNDFYKKLANAKTLDDAISVINERYKDTINLIHNNSEKISRMGKYEQKRMKDTVKNYEKYRTMAVAYFDSKTDKSNGGEVSVKTGRIVSRFYEDSKKLDAGKSKKYWSTPLEMAARAFAAYLVDKLKEKGQKNDYLSGHADNTVYLGEWFPYPTEKDRIKINKAFDELFEVIRNENAIRKSLDILKNREEVKKSLPLFFIKNGRFYIRKS